jgi:hypothetical protein
MLRQIKKIILNQKQQAIRRNNPSAQVTLHLDMPHPSINKITALASVVEKVNALEPKISALSDEELKRKTREFRAFLLEKDKGGHQYRL